MDPKNGMSPEKIGIKLETIIDEVPLSKMQRQMAYNYVQALLNHNNELQSKVSDLTNKVNEFGKKLEQLKEE